ncbi:metallophosphoesterase [Nitrosococcus wardiae]|uniref:Calcineurin-like phosphoesterase domain-containing protein n=1 Tax=Nitrosococcus wardiae TaxID=1814290 RepID=A0A4P7C2L5_9GAMM|nr:metallophosphoesterase [Nitrosococcus wardiae]QBQ55927.1 hypothetical protein E3U44_16450 [Nitrosococcus wardiae]
MENFNVRRPGGQMNRVLGLWLCMTTGVGGVLQAEEGSSVPRSPGAEFSFALIGDLPYEDEQVASFNRLIDHVNRDCTVQFILHAGDIKGGGERCDNDRILARFAQYQRFNRAFIYTPGDNEWTDCHRLSSGGYYPLERLDFLRRTFFPAPDQSTGRHPIRVLSQSEVRGFEDFVENVMFVRNNVVFGTLHVVGSNNDLRPWTGFDPFDSVDHPRDDRLAEFKRRRDAVLAWLDAIFGQAKEIETRGIFITMQADPRFDLPQDDPDRTGFKEIINHLRELTAIFKKPVVLAHGDFHEYWVDKPFDTPHDDPRLPHFTRIQTFGSPRVNWVKVGIAPHLPALFVFEQKIISP